MINAYLWLKKTKHFYQIGRESYFLIMVKLIYQKLSANIILNEKFRYILFKNESHKGDPDDWYCVTQYQSPAATAKSLQLRPTLVRPQRQQPTRPCDSPGKNTRVGCHFLLQCMKVKSESEVVQSCPTLSDPMDCSLPGSSIHGIFQAGSPSQHYYYFLKRVRTVKR